MKNIKYLVVALVLAFGITSCESYDDFDANREVIVGFATGDGNIPTVSSTRERDVEVFITEAASTDLTFNVTVDAANTEITADNYDFPGTVTIPAGERLGLITVTFTNNSLSPDRFPFTLNLSGPDSFLYGKTSVTFQVRGN